MKIRKVMKYLQFTKNAKWFLLTVAEEWRDIVASAQWT